tara:strand:+ start:819 stop:1139 length:321 start_codon:yes stop_codon:yes gene_type:complete
MKLNIKTKSKISNSYKFRLVEKAVKTGLIFGAGHIKKDGTPRFGKYRGGVKIGVKGTGAKHDPNKHGHFKVFDMTINDFRKINSNTLFYIKFFDVDTGNKKTINII